MPRRVHARRQWHLPACAPASCAPRRVLSLWQQLSVRPQRRRRCRAGYAGDAGQVGGAARQAPEAGIDAVALPHSAARLPVLAHGRRAGLRALAENAHIREAPAVWQWRAVQLWRGAAAAAAEAPSALGAAAPRYAGGLTTKVNARGMHSWRSVAAPRLRRELSGIGSGHGGQLWRRCSMAVVGARAAPAGGQVVVGAMAADNRIDGAVG